MTKVKPRSGEIASKTLHLWVRGEVEDVELKVGTLCVWREAIVRTFCFPLGLCSLLLLFAVSHVV